MISMHAYTGAAYDAVKGAVQYVHACAARLAEEQGGQRFSKVLSTVPLHSKYTRALTFENVEQGGRQQLEHLQFSTPQGEEVSFSAILGLF